MDTLTPFTQIACLLCAHMPGQDVAPLSQTEFVSVQKWLAERQLPLEALLEPNAVTLLQEMEADKRLAKLPGERLNALIQRGVSLALWLERWLNAGMWILSWEDDGYPGILTQRLGEQAPVLLYGFGRMELLNEHGLAIVGSRNVSDNLQDLTREIANGCAWEKWNVITGGARGVDRAAMNGVLEEYGACVAVLPADLGRTAADSSLREYLLADKLCLVSPYHPESGFSVGNAMGRNKVIYCLSDCALVVACEKQKGGTWAGAVENLKRGWVPLFVYLGEWAPPDNEHLLAEGAFAFPTVDDQPLRETLLRVASQPASALSEESVSPDAQLTLPM